MIERETQFSNHQKILRKIVRANHLISTSFGNRRFRDLSFTEKEKLENLNNQKNKHLVEALILRKNGDSSVQVALYGNANDELHPYSRNQLIISFPHPNPPHGTYKTATNLKILRGVFDGDTTELIDRRPDKFLEESQNDYIIRTIAEINESGNDLEKAEKRGDLIRKEELAKLKAQLAVKILELRANGKVDRRQLSVKYLKDFTNKFASPKNLIEVTFFPGRGVKKIGFHLLPNFQYSTNKIRELIDRGGGYDRETIRRW